MVSISKVEELKAEINVHNVTYNIEQETAIVTFIVRVSYFQIRQSKAFGIEIKVQEEEIKMIDKLLNEKRNKLNESFAEIKSKISSLLQFSDSVDVSLSEIAKKLLETVK